MEEYTFDVANECVRIHAVSVCKEILLWEHRLLLLVKTMCGPLCIADHQDW